MFRKHKFIFVVMLFAAIFMVKDVNAATLSTSYHICYNKSTGKYNGTSCSGGYTIYKKLDGKDAYCSQLNKSITNKSYSISSGWSTTSKNSLVAGKVIELVNSKYSSTNERYLYATEIINYIFKYSGYANFVDKNSDLKTIYNNAVSAVNNYKYNTATERSKLPVISLNSASSNDMGSTSVDKRYVSNKITLKGLVSNYGGGNSTNNGDTTYTIKVSVNTGTAYICDKQAYSSSCQTSVTVSKPSAATKEFYVVVNSGAAGENVTINVTGSNKSTYPTVTRYESNSSSQKLMVKGTTTFSRTISTSLTLSIPDNTMHTIKVLKVDNEGNALIGATLVLFKADSNEKQVGDNLRTNSNGAANLTYTVTKASDNDDFFDYKYCVKETKSPAGFVLGNSNTICYKPTKNDSTTCLNSDGEVMSDANYCGAYYTCKNDGYELDASTNKCQKTITIDATPSTSCVSGTLINDSNNDNNGKCQNEIAAIITTNEEGVEVSRECPSNSTTITNGDGSIKCYAYTEPTTSYSCSSDYTQSGASCIKTEQTNATCVGGAGKEGNYCEATDQYMSVVQKGGNLTITKSNTKTLISISKTDVTGENEVPGAILKICDSKPDKNGDCDAVKLTQKGLACPTYSDELDEEEASVYNCTYDSKTDTRVISVSWVSSDVSKTWEGLETNKTYYLVEQTPPNGYISVTTATEFVINEDGTVKAGKTEVEDGRLVIKNQLTKMTISKSDIASSKEVPGATISICESYIDEDGKLGMSVDDFGDCTVVTLADGSPASWVSEKEPHVIEGLPVGTYYLVENIAPSGYDTAESIIFTMNADGTVSDANGKLLDGNKLTMYDKKLNQVITGDIIIAIIAVLVVAGCSTGIYFYRKKKVSK